METSTRSKFLLAHPHWRIPPLARAADPHGARECFPGGNALTSAGLIEFNSTFSADLDDFFIKTITETAEKDEFWQLVFNFKRADVGGGQLRVTTGDSVLWALVNGYQTLVPLRLKGPASVKINTKFKVTVLDGETRKPVPLVPVGPSGGRTDINGQVEIEYDTPGHRKLRADVPGIYVRSNVLVVWVGI